MAYAQVYLDEVVETQGRLFDLVANKYPNMDTAEFIQAYMSSSTRKYIDDGQAYVCTMSQDDLLEYFMVHEDYSLKPGTALTGFMPDWIGQFYAYYQWHYDIPSATVIQEIPLTFLKQAYGGLHDLQLHLAVQKVGGPRRQ